MIKNIIFDFGAVLVDWNPHYVFDPYFGERSRADWFLEHICNGEWNGQMDAGKPFDQGVAELSARYPEWAAEIRLYRDRWTDMLRDGIPGMYELVKELKDKGFRLYGLSNWSAETFYGIEGDYPVFALLDGKVISGDVHLIKPDIRIFWLLLEKFGLKPEECVFIDDNAANVAASEAAGIRSIRFVDAARLREALYRISV